MKNRVSRDIRIYRHLRIPYIIVVAWINIYTFLISNDKLETGEIFGIHAVSLIFLLIGNLLYKYLDKAKTIEYDDSNLYISDKFGTKAIPLEKVISLRRTSIKFNDNYGWKIIYGGDNKEQSATFFAKMLNTNLRDFGNMIKNKNPHANIQEFSFGAFQIDKVVED